MIDHRDSRQDAALDWIVRTSDPAFDDWEGFTEWLEQDPANADAYHRLASSEADLRPMIEAAKIAPETVGRPSRFRPAIAASIALFAAAGAILVAPRLMPVDHATAPGEIRTIALGGSDQLVLNGDTEVTLNGFDRRDIRLDRGQIFLRLADAGKDRVEIRSGDLRLVDIGTMFEVTRDGAATRVVVSEGTIVADPGGASLRLTAGQRLDTSDGAAVLQAVAADPQSAGSFQRGQLVYADEPLDRVVSDLRRSTGIDFSASDAMKSRRFSGTLSVAEVKRDPRSLEPLLGVSMRQTGPKWTLGVSE